jgi:NTE family protein
MVKGKPERLLDQIDQISSVSGGSFTAAYYGLKGDGIFDTYKEAFLVRDVEKHFFWSVLNPIEWFRKGGRTEMAIRYYDDNVFHNATFADMKKDGPLIIINASGLGNGIRFSFIQEYFDLFCSDLDQFSVAKAVTASSAVPIIFLPVVLEKYSGCDLTTPEWLEKARKKVSKYKNPLLRETVRGIDILINKERLRYVHLVDGGITDNLGLLALYDYISLSGGALQTVHYTEVKPPKYFVVIIVNSSTDPNNNMDTSTEEPSIFDTIDTMSDIQLHRYNSATQNLIISEVHKWAKAISTPEREVKTYIIDVSIRNIKKSKLRFLLNKVPTNFSLDKKTVDHLIDSATNLLYDNPEYQRLISDLNGKAGVE